MPPALGPMAVSPAEQEPSRRRRQWQRPADVSGGGLRARPAKRMIAQPGFRAHLLGYRRPARAKDYERSCRFLREAVTADRDNPQDATSSPWLIEGAPLDALGFGGSARDRHPRQNGGDEIERWCALANASTAAASGRDSRRPGRGETSCPVSSSRSRAGRQPRPPRWWSRRTIPVRCPSRALVLRHRDATAANKTAAEKLWQAIQEKQQGHPAQDAGQDRRVA